MERKLKMIGLAFLAIRTNGMKKRPPESSPALLQPLLILLRRCHRHDFVLHRSPLVGQVVALRYRRREFVERNHLGAVSYQRSAISQTILQVDWLIANI